MKTELQSSLTIKRTVFIRCGIRRYFLQLKTKQFESLPIVCTRYLKHLNHFKDSIAYLNQAINLGAIFTTFQFIEYVEALFSISTNAYGSLFFMCTGFHGFHVLIGTILLIVTHYRLLSNDLIENYQHIGYEASA